MKCFFYEDYQSFVSTATPSGYIIICDQATFIRRQVSQEPGEGDHYKQVKLQLSFSIIIFYYHFPCLFLCVCWFVSYSYESYFSQIKQLVCGIREAWV